MESPTGGFFLVVKVSTTKEINTAIKKQLGHSKTVKITGLNGQNYIAVGLSLEKKVTFDGTPGDFFGALNNGPILNLKGDARRFLGDSMSKGGIIVQGNVQRGVGLAMTGGIIVIRGNVSGDSGQLIKGGSIIISGNSGARTGAFMLNGELIISGDVGKNIGQYMVGGVIFVGGKITSLGDNARTLEINEKDKSKLKKYFEHYGIAKDIEKFKKIVPIVNNPLKDKWFETREGSTTSKLLKSESEVDEIIGKSKTGLLSLSGPNNLKKQVTSYFDNLSILPTQTHPNSSTKLLEFEVDTNMTIGDNLESPLKLGVPILLSARGLGMVSKSSKMAFAYATGKLNSALDSGGITSEEEYELITKYRGQLIHQWNSDRMGIDIEYLRKGNAIEIVLGKGGAGSLSPVIPFWKLNRELCEAWKMPEAVDIFLPPKMFDLDVPADLKRHVELLKEITEYKVPILIKLAAGNVYEDTKLAVRAGADAVVIEGYDGCNQNLPAITADNLGLLSIGSIPPANKALIDTRADVRGFKLIISGMFRNGADVFKALALGADAVVLNSSAEIAIGCKLCGNCISNNCPEGIATTNPELETKLDWVEAGKKLTNYLNSVTLELKLLMMLCGYKNINDLDKKSLNALDYETAAVTGTQLAGYGKILPMWEH